MAAVLVYFYQVIISLFLETNGWVFLYTFTDLTSIFCIKMHCPENNFSPDNYLMFQYVTENVFDHYSFYSLQNSNVFHQNIPKNNTSIPMFNCRYWTLFSISSSRISTNENSLFWYKMIGHTCPNAVLSLVDWCLIAQCNLFFN